MCDRLNEKDERFGFAMRIVNEDGCAETNEALSNCLKTNGNNFALCRDETKALRVCMESSKARSDKAGVKDN